MKLISIVPCILLPLAKSAELDFLDYLSLLGDGQQVEELGLLSDETNEDGSPKEKHSRKKLKEDHMYSGYFPVDTKG